MKHTVVALKLEQNVSEILITKQICIIDYPAYATDLSPCNNFLFSELKTAMKATVT